ncbi:MAG: hypothetical protein WBQ79_20585 [Acidobacteriaceae bacterium]
MGLVFDQKSTERRAAFLRGLYDIVHGSVTKLVYVEQVTRVLHFDEQDAEAAIEVLVAEDLVRIRLQCILSITQAGIDEVRAAHVAPPPKPTPPAPQPAVQSSVSHTLLGAGAFPQEDTELPPAAPPVEIQHHHDDVELKLICEAIGLDPRELIGMPEIPAAAGNGHPALAEAGAPRHALRTQPLPSDPDEIAGTLSSLKLRLLKLRLSKDDLAEAEAEIATATAQLLSPRPKQPIIAASLGTLLAILDGPGAASMTIDLQVSLTEIRLFLAQIEA